MIVVTLPGDKIETKDGITFTVLSYTNYREKGPAVYVEHTPSVPSDAVYFFDIARLNGKTVDYVAGWKVFRAAGTVKRKIHLPQPDDKLTFKSKELGTVTITVDSVKLHRRGQLAKGMMFIGKDSEGEVQEARLEQIIDVDRAIGNDFFSRDKLLSVYSDYKGNNT